MSQARGTRVRFTRQAAAIVEVMSGMRTFRGARDVYDALRDTGQQVGIATVYRHLRVLAEQGEVDTIRVARGERLYRLRDGDETCQLTCRACGQAVIVDASAIRDWAARMAVEAGFTLTGYAIHLEGLCPVHPGQ